MHSTKMKRNYARAIRRRALHKRKWVLPSTIHKLMILDMNDAVHAGGEVGVVGSDKGRDIMFSDQSYKIFNL